VKLWVSICLSVQHSGKRSVAGKKEPVHTTHQYLQGSSWYSPWGGLCAGFMISSWAGSSSRAWRASPPELSSLPLSLPWWSLANHILHVRGCSASWQQSQVLERRPNRPRGSGSPGHPGEHPMPGRCRSRDTHMCTVDCTSGVRNRTTFPVIPTASSPGCHGYQWCNAAIGGNWQAVFMFMDGYGVHQFGALNRSWPVSAWTCRLQRGEGAYPN